jgi:ATP-dependent helicase/nuclease subunit A
MKLNAEQAAAAHDVDRHVLVSAGAGTGKTQCVVARVLYALGEPIAGRQLPPEQRRSLRDIAAITFTNVAAADLQRKLREALREAGRTAEAYQVDTARIGTIHAFCGHVLREFALQLGRSPGVVLLDEAESVALAAEGAREALLGAVESGDLPGLDDLLGAFSVEEVRGFAARLAADADRLALIAADEAMSGRERALATLAERTLGRMRRRLDERMALDFDAMITLVRDLLRDRPDVRRVLQRRIRMLIVDEFQDVDPAQQEIAYLLAEPASRRTDTTRLMLVGDAKQSIFRFRRADVTVWTRVRRDFAEAGYGAVHVLSENFRSRRPILGFVDASVGAELDAALGANGVRADHEVPFEPLVACPANETSEPCVELLALPAGADGKALSGEAARGFEIPAAARRVRELVDAGTAPKDIALLVPAWAPAADFQAALRAAGIASWTLRNEGFFERREVLDCLVALRAVLDPLDDPSLFGLLRSPLVGVKDETLLAVARQAKPPYIRRLAQVETDEADLLAFGADLVARFAALRDRVPHDELLDQMLEETGYLAHLALLGDDGRQPQANVRKLMRMLRGWRHLTLREALRVVAEFREREEGSREGDAPLAARDDAVTITSIHSAKGLEWPVVVWADLTRGAGGVNAKCLIGRSAMRLRDQEIADVKDDARFQALRSAEALEEQAQRKRVWYVAATRAKARLIVSGVPLGVLAGRHRDSAATCLVRLGVTAAPAVAYRDHFGMTFAADVRVAEPAQAGEAEALEPLPVLAAETIRLAPAPVPVLAGRPRHSASELLTFSRCARKHWFQYVAGLREPPIDRGSAEYLDAVTRGHIVHDVLEHVREADELDQLLEDAIGRWDPDAPPPDGAEGLRYRGVLREEVEQVVRHPGYRAVAELPGARRELAFVQLIAADRWMQGRLDLAAVREDGLVIVDVKTGAQADEAAARKRAAAYGPQRDVYVAAVEATAGREVAEFAFHFSRAGAHLPEPVTPASRVAGAAGVAAMLARIEAGERSLTANPHECRFCGFREVGWCEGVRAIRTTNVGQAGGEGT